MSNFELTPELHSKLETKKLYSLLGFDLQQITGIEAVAKTENSDSKEVIRKWALVHV